MKTNPVRQLEAARLEIYKFMAEVQDESTTLQNLANILVEPKRIVKVQMPGKEGTA